MMTRYRIGWVIDFGVGVSEAKVALYAYGCLRTKKKTSSCLSSSNRRAHMKKN